MSKELFRNHLINREQDERGATLAVVAASIVVLLGMGALAVDVGMLYTVRTKLQATADASALAAAQELPDAADVTSMAIQYATANYDEGAVVTADEVVLGRWDEVAGTFTPGANPPNAVNVTARRQGARGNAVPTFFARVLGRDWVDVSARATATGVNGGGSRFILDEEVFDSDIPVIEDLADQLGVPPDELISDMDGDWFIDLPAGVILELPSGQVGDEGLFDMTHPSFPFQEDESFQNFLNYNEDSNSWRYDLLDKSELDPLIGVPVVNDPSVFPSFVTDECQISPLYKSDVSELNPVDGDPAVNALGWRRGLVRFKIIGVGVDPDGPGSVLPNLIFEICPPLDDIELSDIHLGLGPKIRLVQ